MCRPTDVKSVFRTAPPVLDITAAKAGDERASGFKTGRWSDHEHEVFLKALKRFGKNWKEVSKSMKTRSPVQVRTHAQKFFLKVARTQQQQRARSNGDGDVDIDIEYTSLKKDTAILSKCLEMATAVEQKPIMKQATATTTTTKQELYNPFTTMQQTAHSSSDEFDSASDSGNSETNEILKNLAWGADEAVFEERTRPRTLDVAPAFKRVKYEQPRLYKKEQKEQKEEEVIDYSKLFMDDLQIFEDEESKEEEQREKNWLPNTSSSSYEQSSGQGSYYKYKEPQQDDIDLMDLLYDGYKDEPRNSNYYPVQQQQQHKRMYEDSKFTEFPYESKKSKLLQPNKEKEMKMSMLDLGTIQERKEQEEKSSSSLDRAFAECFDDDDQGMAQQEEKKSQDYGFDDLLFCN